MDSGIEPPAMPEVHLTREWRFGHALDGVDRPTVGCTALLFEYVGSVRA